MKKTFKDVLVNSVKAVATDTPELVEHLNASLTLVDGDPKIAFTTQHGEGDKVETVVVETYGLDGTPEEVLGALRGDGLQADAADE